MWPTAPPKPTLDKVVQDSVVFLTDTTLFSLAGIRIAFSYRHGGVSPAPYASLNLGAYVGDDDENVAINRARFLRACGLPDLAHRMLNSARQVHGTHIEHAVPQTKEWPDTDALMTNQTHYPLLLCFADCVPIIVVSVWPQVVAVIHSGWRGTLDGISAVAIDEMRRTYDLDHARLFAYIGPHIGPESFSVSAETAEHFFDRFDNADCIKPYNKSGADDRINLDLGACVTETLVRAGVQPCNIIESPIDTVSATRDLFSYRAENQVTGRFGALGCICSLPVS